MTTTDKTTSFAEAKARVILSTVFLVPLLNETKYRLLQNVSHFMLQ